MSDDPFDRENNGRGKGRREQAVKLPYSPEVTHRKAAEAEWFWALPYGLEDQVAWDRPRPHDFVLGNGDCIDIKWTPRYDGRLLYKKKPDPQHFCTIYVLITGEPGSFVVRGWARGRELAQHFEPRLPKPAYAMTQSLLRSPEALQDWMLGRGYLYVAERAA